MVKKNRLHLAQLESLRVYVENDPGILMDMLYAHGAGCHLRAAGEVLLTMLEWTREDVCQAWQAYLKAQVEL